jgi:hypothetical protein
MALPILASHVCLIYSSIEKGNYRKLTVETTELKEFTILSQKLKLKFEPDRGHAPSRTGPWASSKIYFTHLVEIS